MPSSPNSPAVVAPVGTDEGVVGVAFPISRKRVRCGVSPWLKSAIQISPLSNRLNTKRCPGASTRPTTREVPVLAGEAGGGNLGDQLQGAAVEHLDPARLVVGYRDQPTVLADRSADAVAALDQALVDALGQQVELGQAAVATGIRRRSAGRGRTPGRRGTGRRGLRPAPARSSPCRRGSARCRRRVRSARRGRRCRARAAAGYSRRAGRGKAARGDAGSWGDLSSIRRSTSQPASSSLSRPAQGASGFADGP